MYFRICDDILFRQYDGHGYITDNSEFGYRFLNNSRPSFGEAFVTESGAAMLSELSREPREIDDVVDDLMLVFEGVGREELKADAIEFFRLFVSKGYLSEGDSPEACARQASSNPKVSTISDASRLNPATESFPPDSMGPNDFLRSVHFDIASACNERCVHCYIPGECKAGIIDPELFFRTLEEARELNAVHVTLSGGEPLLHGDIVDFLKRCRELDFSVNVLSNLTLLTEGIVAEMGRNPLLSVQTSLYSVDPEIHDAITGLAGSFEMTKAGILRLCSAGIPVQISCPVMKQNKDGFIDVVAWGKERNVAVAVEPVIFGSCDRSGGNLGNRISLDELEGVLDKELSEGYAAAIRESAKEKVRLTGDDPICSVCRYSLCVSVEGGVFPCAGWQSHVIGDLKRSPLKEIWEESEEIKRLRSITRGDFPECVSCEHRCYCTVCMMVNANENPDGNPLAIDRFHCQVAAITHRKMSEFAGSASGGELAATPE